VSDCEAIQSIKQHPTKLNIDGLPMLDYKTMPKHFYVPAKDSDGTLLSRDENDEPYTYFDGEKVQASDGARFDLVGALTLGAIKELDNRLKKLESK
jgi:hypothetical protein